jgi:hypothetical protein
VIAFFAAPSFHDGNGSDGAWARETLFANLILRSLWNIWMFWNKRPVLFRPAASSLVLQSRSDVRD